MKVERWILGVISLLCAMGGGKRVLAQEFPESHMDFLSSDSYQALKVAEDPESIAHALQPQPQPLAAAKVAKVGGQVGPNVQVNDLQFPFPDGFLGRSETTIAADPSGRFLLVGWNDADGFCGPPYGALCTAPPPVPGLSGFGFSSDGGETWTDGGVPFPVVTAGGIKVTRGDPWMDVGGPGRKTFYYANLAVDVTSTYPGLGGMVVHRGEFSRNTFGFNHGVFIASPNAPNDFLDKEALCAGHTTATKDQVAVSVTNFMEVGGIPFFGFGQIEVYTSTDRASTFPTRGIPQPDETISVRLNEGILNQGSACAIGPNGEVYVTWERGHFFPFRQPNFPVGVQPPQIVFARSDDGGQTFTPRVLISDISSGALFPPAGYNRGNTNDFPRICVATNEDDPFWGRIYVVYQDSRLANGGTQAQTGGFGNGDTDIYLRFSDDSGNTWSSPTLVAGGGDGKIQFWPVVSCNQSDGTVDVTWYESVETGGTSLVNVYYAGSSDGGATFSAPLRVSEVTTDWGATTTNIVPNFGDYIFHVSKSNRVMATWADGRNGVPDVFYATIGVGNMAKESALLTASPSTGLALQQNYPNPSNPETTIRFALPVAGEVELTLFNLAGQRVATLVQGVRDAGTYTVRWDGRDDAGQALASGVYLYRLQAGNGKQVQTRKLLLLR